VLIPLQLLVVLALADLSSRVVELPFRGRRELPSLPDGWLRVARPALAFGVVAVVALVGWGGLVSSRGEAGVPAASTAELARVTAAPGSGRGGGGGREGRGARDRPPRIVAFGDWVMFGA
jgi:hypothetical protein